MGRGRLETELIEEGLRQLKERGMDGFSARAVAEACHVSCAAPFKYFKGRHEFLMAISERIDEELTERMECILEQYPDDHRQAHLAMNEAYIQCLIQYPFLMDASFWQTFEQLQSGIHSWKSFCMMTEQLKLYSEQQQFPEQLRKAYYYNFQVLAYGSAFVANSGLVLEGEQPMERIRELENRIYKDMEQVQKK